MAIVIASPVCLAQPEPPRDVRVVDVPGDDGTALRIVWEPSPDDPCEPVPRDDELAAAWPDLTRAEREDRAWEMSVDGRLVDAWYEIRRASAPIDDPDREPLFDASRWPDHTGTAGEREWTDTHFAYLPPLGEDTELRSFEPPSLDELEALRAESLPRDPRHNTYSYAIRFVLKGVPSEPVIVTGVRPVGNGWDGRKTPALIGTGALCLVVALGMVRNARRGSARLREIAGLREMRTTILEAAELDRPVLFVPGVGDLSGPSGIAALAVYRSLAQAAAEAGTRLVVPCGDGVAVALAREVARETWRRAGRESALNEEDVHLIACWQMPYAAAVAGLIERLRPSTVLYVGAAHAEALILTETAYRVGCRQIAADAGSGLAWFVPTCDHTLMGEELYAAGPALSGERLAVGSIQGHDAAKLLLAAAIVALVGLVTVLTLTGNDAAADRIMALFETVH